MDPYNISFDWTVNNLTFGSLFIGTRETISLVFPNETKAEQNAGYWYLKLIISSPDVTLKLCLARGEILNYYFSAFEVNLFCKKGFKWAGCSSKSLFNIKHNQEYSFKTFATKGLLEYLDGDQSKSPIKISCKMSIKVEKCMINIVPHEMPDFEKLLDDPEFSDFVIITSGKQFKVHKNILAARSEVFSAMIKNEMKEKREGIAQITDFDDEVVEEMLRYVYCGRVQHLDTLSEELLRAADKYSVHGLESICLEEISKSICVENALDLLSQVDYYKVGYLKENILNFIVINIRKFDQSQLKSLANSNLSNEILLKMTQFIN